MTNANHVDSEFHELMARSQEILTSIRSKRESGHFDWFEVHDLSEELSKLLDQMTAMVVSQHSNIK